jgi:hypothetical protein
MSSLPLTNNTAIGTAPSATPERRRPTFALKGWLSRRRPFVGGSDDLRARKRRAHFGARGAVVVELLIAYIPVLFCFLAFWQLGELLVAQMVVARASSAAGRAAVVVLPDDPMFYSGEAKGTLGGKRQGNVRMAAGMILAASPHLADDFELDISEPPQDLGVVATTVTANFRCNRLRFVCGMDGVVSLSAASSHAYQGARYEYAPTDLTGAGAVDLTATSDASCFDGTPGKNGSGGKNGSDGTGGKGDGTGGRTGSGGSGGNGSGGNSGASAGGNGGCPPGESKNPDGSCSTSRGPGDGSCKPGYQANADGTCSSPECAKIKDSRKRKACDVNGPCPNGQDERDEVGECCAKLRKVELADGSTAMRCNEEKLACVNQESAKGNNGHSLTGTVVADDTTLKLPDIAPDFKEICGDGNSCSAASNSGFVKDIGVKIVANLKLKQKASWCVKDDNGQRKKATEEIKQEWNDWAKSYKPVWLKSGEAQTKIDAWLKKNPGKSRKNAESAVWSTKKSQLDSQRDKNADAGVRPRAGEGNVPGYSGPNSSIAPFFKALDDWCAELEKVGDSAPYEKYLTPEVKAVEDKMLASLKAMPSSIQTSIDASLMSQTGSNHTEKKVIELIEGWAAKNGKDLKNMNLKMDLVGDWSPCETCTTALKDFVSTYGGTAHYCWTKGIYSGGIARQNPKFVVTGGELMGGTIKHQGCVTISPTGTTFTGETLCKQGEKNGKKSKSTAN